MISQDDLFEGRIFETNIYGVPGENLHFQFDLHLTAPPHILKSKNFSQENFQIFSMTHPMEMTNRIAALHGIRRLDESHNGFY